MQLFMQLHDTWPEVVELGRAPRLARASAPRSRRARNRCPSESRRAAPRGSPAGSLEPPPVSVGERLQDLARDDHLVHFLTPVADARPTRVPRHLRARRLAAEAARAMYPDRAVVRVVQ